MSIVEEALRVYRLLSYESLRVEELRDQLNIMISHMTPEQLVEYLKRRSSIDAGVAGKSKG